MGTCYFFVGVNSQHFLCIWKAYWAHELQRQIVTSSDLWLYLRNSKEPYLPEKTLIEILANWIDKVGGGAVQVLDDYQDDELLMSLEYSIYTKWYLDISGSMPEEDAEHAWPPHFPLEDVDTERVID